MRKVFVFVAVAALTLGLFSPAEAAKKKTYSISFSPSPGGVQEPYNDTALNLNSSSAPKNMNTTIRAKIKGGKVAGKRVTIYATNMNSQARTRTSLGTAKISKRGYVTKRFVPVKGRAGLYKIEVVKKAGRGYRAKTTTFYIRVFEYVSLARFYQPAASTPGFVVRSDKEQVGPTTKDRWTESYGLQGPGTAVYDFRGYGCSVFGLKIGLSYYLSTSSGRYSVDQPVRGTIMSGSKDKGGGFDEPSKAAGRSLRADQPFMVSVTGDQGTRFVLGNPKLACMIPTALAPAPL